MTRRILVVLAVLAIAFSVTPIASASPVKPTTTTEIHSNAAFGNCQTIGTYNEWTGTSVTHAGWVPTGAIARFQNRGRLHECTDTTGLDFNSGPSYWLALAAPGFNNIVQIGVIDCSSTDQGNTACDFSTARYFFSYGWQGCSGVADHPPKALDLGTAGTGAVTFKLEWVPAEHAIKLYINGSHVQDVVYSGNALCWLNDPANVEIEWLGERWDQADGVGAADADGGHVLVDNMLAGYASHGWNNPGLVSGAWCDSVGEMYCYQNTSDSFDMWTIQS